MAYKEFFKTNDLLESTYFEKLLIEQGLDYRIVDEDILPFPNGTRKFYLNSEIPLDIIAGLIKKTRYRSLLDPRNPSFNKAEDPNEEDLDEEIGYLSVEREKRIRELENKSIVELIGSIFRKLFRNG
ncbi:hypothetical protein CH373_18285 [Leptospira perolatii]|uniref:Uncharacterized protein n=1 Tax=Leptospira perolatii TaxID=2023191 RepID=A0A2M9ZHY1_9LEPT|nr:hypothetical protein [Leptospira perolatii]PJZ68023.1 hypothetical protein CH360_18355 [Leptospira perolatii]PJZ71668.1 hypothetical protein CH373_18285 [Leptospira perolatii]